MSDNNVKLIRKQIKNVVQDLLPSVITQELRAELYKQLSQEVKGQLQALESQVKATLKEMDDRSKDAQSYIIREMSKNIHAQAVPPQPDAPLKSE